MEKELDLGESHLQRLHDNNNNHLGTLDPNIKNHSYLNMYL